jgi:predicted flap endonuclease-1-like 5' DNA nuclease
MNNYVLWILVGIIIGWVIEWVVDWLFWRQENKKLQFQLAASEAEIQQLKTQLANLTEEQARLKQLEVENQGLQSRLARLEPLAAPAADQINQVDDLQHITGIGPIYAERLNDAGIYTYAQLAQLTPEQLQTIVQPEEWQNFNAERWIVQAKEFAHGRAVELPRGE